ncbi:hypothetical protein BH23GEM2_BH23GEM2_06250 [soil metagenome]
MIQLEDSAIRQRWIVGALITVVAAAAAPASAQTDYYNTDSGRPLTVEDAYPTERYAFELQLAPVRVERSRGGIYTWSVEPEIAYGICPRTHIELGAPLSYTDAGGVRRSGLAGLELGVLHNLNAETVWPALAIAAEMLFPIGSLAPDRGYGTVKGIATRTLSWARFHLNGAYTFGSEPEVETLENGSPHVRRWLGGIAVDHTFPLRALLIGGEVVASQPIVDHEDVEWSVAAGARYQVSPVIAIDAGVGKTLTGEAQPWFLTFGMARAFGVRALFPVPRGAR